ncbi:MAG TPA: S26 family signal peptidase [Streptosporangiaceae bacterium]|nr:S26 family signal peptidase [Streptosporangiaceae bacterium]
MACGRPGLADIRVPAGKLVVLSDNAEDSYNSRAIGYIRGDRLLGSVIRRMPANRPG